MEGSEGTVLVDKTQKSIAEKTDKAMEVSSVAGSEAAVERAPKDRKLNRLRCRSRETVAEVSQNCGDSRTNSS